MYNDTLDCLTEYPFDRLRHLLDNLEPPNKLEPVMMSLGEPQHDPPPLIAETIASYSGEWGKYPPIVGTSDLLIAIVDWLGNRYNLTDRFLEPSKHVVCVNGTKEALFMAGDLCIPRSKRGQRPAVLIPNPFYQVYMGATVVRDAEPIYLPATKETGFLPEFQSLDPILLERTALAYLCTPSNPQGAIADIQYLKTAIELARRYDFVLAVDECYSEIYDSVQPPGVLQACQEMDNDLTNVLAFHSLSKRSNAPGLRSGFVAGDPKLVAWLKKLRNYGGAAVPVPLLAASTALWQDEVHVEHNRSLYRQKFDRADQILDGRLDYSRPAGGFYLWLNVGNGEEATRRLWTEAGVRVIPGKYLSNSGPNNVSPGDAYIRIALVQKLNIVGDALTRLVQTL